MFTGLFSCGRGGGDPMGGYKAALTVRGSRRWQVFERTFTVRRLKIRSLSPDSQRGVVSSFASSCVDASLWTFPCKRYIALWGWVKKVGSTSGAHTAAPGEVLRAKGLRIAKIQCFVEACFFFTDSRIERWNIIVSILIHMIYRARWGLTHGIRIVFRIIVIFRIFKWKYWILFPGLGKHSIKFGGWCSKFVYGSVHQCFCFWLKWYTPWYGSWFR